MAFDLPLGILILTINNGTDSGNVMLKYDEDGLLEISFYIHFYNNNIYAIDNILKRIQKFKMDGTPRLVIGDKKDKPSKTGGVRYSYFNFRLRK